MTSLAQFRSASFSVALLLVCTVGPRLLSAADLSIKATQDDNTATILRDGRPVLVYHKPGTPFKPYVKELYTPGGVQILRDSPADHKHHHGLMFAVAADGVDFWAETPNCGRQTPAPGGNCRSTAVNGSYRAIFDQQLDWTSAAGKPALRETRSIEVRGESDLPATLLTWRSRLETPADRPTVVLSGSHYFGLGMRFVVSMDAAGRFFNSEGKEGPIVRGSERVSPAKWCAYTSQADGKPVTVAMFDSPKNPRPAQFFTMRPFAYLSVTLNVWKQPLTLKGGEPIDLCYGIALWDGEIDAARVQEVYDRWVKGMEP
jgi:hypothetical protein